MVPRDKKILVVCGGFKLYGAENATLTLMRALRQGGAEVACFTGDWSDGGFKAALDAEGFTYRSAKIGWFYLTRPWWTLATLGQLPRTWWVFWRLIRRFQPDVVVHVSYRTLAYLYPLLGRNNILWVQDQLSKDRQANRLLPWLDPKVERYLTCSTFTLGDLTHLRLNQSKALVLTNCTEIPPHPLARVFDGTLKLGIAGQIRPHKGHSTLIKALGILFRQGLPFHLDIFGTGDAGHLEELRAKCQSEGVLDRVTFRGFESDRRVLYGGLDVAVVPTITEEPFGLAALEPAAYGLPVIASDTGGLPEIIEPAVTGLLFPPGDAAALAACIRVFADEPGRLITMGVAARQRAMACFSGAVMLERLREIGLVKADVPCA